MLFNFFIEIDGQIISVDEAAHLNRNLNDTDWYYLSGSVEVSQDDKVYISREDTTDIIPFAYEFFSLFILLEKINDLKIGLPHVLSGKMCSKTVLYHPDVGIITTQHMNGVYLDTVFTYYDKSPQSVTTEKEGFFEMMKDSFYRFDKAIRALFPNTDMPMLDEIQEIMHNKV